MSRCVKLDQLPDKIGFPAELSDRISYDAQSRQICFEGFMSKSDFDKLLCIHNDVGYQRAIEQLFQICTFDDPTPSNRSAVPIVLAAVAAFAITLGVVAFLILR